MAALPPSASPAGVRGARLRARPPGRVQAALRVAPFWRGPRCGPLLGLVAALSLGAGAGRAASEPLPEPLLEQVERPGVAAVERCLEDEAAAARVTTDYGCAEAAYLACARAAPGAAGLQPCLAGTRAVLARAVAGQIDALPRRAPAGLGMPQDEYRRMRRSLVAAPDWPGCPEGDAGAVCLYRHVAEQWVETRALVRALDALAGREAE